MRLVLACLLLGLSVGLSLGDPVIIDNELHALVGHLRVAPYTDLMPLVLHYYRKQFKDGKSDVGTKSNFYLRGDECMSFLERFRSGGYQVKSFDEILVMDNCLGYLFGKGARNRRDEDTAMNKVSKTTLYQYMNDDQLSGLYNGTTIETLSYRVRNCFADLISYYVFTLMNTEEQCNLHHIQYLARFASCQRGDDPENPLVSETLRNTDTYLKLIYKLVGTGGKKCYEEQIKTIEINKNRFYAWSRDHATNVLLRGISEGRSQNDQLKMRDQEAQLFRMIQFGETSPDFRRPYNWIKRRVKGSEEETPAWQKNHGMETNQRDNNQISMKRISQMMKNLLQKEELVVEHVDENGERVNETVGYKGTFLNNISKYATTKGSKFNDGEYAKMMTKICKPYREIQGEEFRSYATQIKWLTVITDFVDIFHITKDDFIIKILVNGRQTTPLYYGVAFCILLENSIGTKYITAKGRPVYRVSLKENYRDLLVDWPMIDYD